MRLVITVALLLALVTVAPTRPLPPPLQKSKAEQPPAGPVVYESNWGKITITGKTIQIEGHPTWFALGNVREDGKIQLVWTLSDGSRSGLGVYERKGDEWTGSWQWGENAYLNKDGELVPVEGENLMTDRTFRLKPGMDDTPDPFN